MAIITVETPQSSNIAKLELDDVTKKLVAWFKGGGAHEYDEVSQREFDEVIHPGIKFEYSVGRAFHYLIKLKKKGRPYIGKK